MREPAFGFAECRTPGPQVLDDAFNHIEYLLQGSEQLWPNVDDWLGDAGEGWRRRCQYSVPKMSSTLIRSWREFRAARANRTMAEILEERQQLVTA